MFGRAKIKRATPEEVKKWQEEARDEKIPMQDKAIIVLTGLVVVVLPALAILVGLALLALWVFGAL